MSTGTQRWIMHLDMDAFYAAVEQRDDPTLRGRPVVVGAQPGGRGVVATCSYEARTFGIRSAMPINEAHRRCPQVVFIRPRMAHYTAVARQIREVMAAYSPLVEPASIDEAYLDVSGLERLIGPPETIGQRIKADIRAAVGLTASVGIGPNRLVAKIASDFAKPDGLTVVHPERVLDFLGAQRVGVLRGLGAKTLPKLTRLGIGTVADLRRLSREQLQALVGARFAVDLTRSTRPDDDIAPGFTKEYVNWGAGTRAVQYLVLGAKARAAIEGEYNVTCDHVRAVAPLVLRHRIIANFHAEADGVTPDRIVEMLLEVVEEPLAESYA